MGEVIKLVRNRQGFLIRGLRSTFGGALTGFPLDDYPGAEAGYSVRLLSSTYTGSAIRVRRSSDNAEQNIGFVGNVIDSAGLLSFVGAGDGFITTWYDQSGNGNNATQGTAADQPQIVSSGSVITEGGLPAIENVSEDTLNLDTQVRSQSIFVVHKKTTEATINYISGGSTPAQGVFVGGSSVSGQGIYVDPTTVSNSQSEPSNRNIYTFISDGVNGYTATNTYSLTNNGSVGALETDKILGRGNTIFVAGYGTYQEFIIFRDDKSTVESGIRSNLNQYFNVYWDGSQTGLLDTYSNAEVCYSLRALSSAYTGPLVRVRRLSDNAELDIYARYDGTLDTNSLETFCAATDGFVTTWYDQSGNGKNAIQTTAAQQPRIVASGVIDLFGSKPTIDFGAVANPNLTASTFTLQSGETAYSIFMAADMPSDLATQHYLDYASPTFLFRWAILTNGTTRVQNNDNVPTSSLPLVAVGYETNYIFSFIRTLTSAQVTASSISGTALTGLNAPDNAGTQSLIIGTASSLPFKGKMSELILYGEDKTVDRDAIKQNINEHYNVYWDGTQTSILDTYSGAVGAYSLRALSSSYTGPLLRIRRSSDNAELNIYAKRDGTLDTDALETFCAATDGFVVTWYDQSGNGNDAEQPSAAVQPQLVTAGSVNLSNTKPSLMTGVGHQLPTTLGNTTYDIFGVTGYTKDSTTVGVMFGSTNVNDYYWAADNGGVTTALFNNVTQNALYINGAVETPVNRGDQYDLTNPQAIVYADLTISFATPGLSFGYRVASAQDFMLWQECIIYDSDQSANRANIETLLNTYYNVF